MLPTDLLQHLLTTQAAWREQWGSYTAHPTLQLSSAAAAHFQTYLDRLSGNYPFFHPRYAGQMLKPPHPIAMLGYWAAMFFNPNNHALDGGAPTSEMEKEVIIQLAQMFRLPASHLGHLTSSGTIANLEALWVARKIHPTKKIAFSADAHYTHERMCEVLQVPSVKIPTDAMGRMDLNALETELKKGDIGTVVMTVGTTGIGALDPVHEALALKEKYGVRIHIDSAYGGFFTVLAYEDAPVIDPLPFRAIAHCDSVVVDPHKHGLQPYGCGAVLFADSSVGQFYKHDSPYTYFTSKELHLGEISLECSRAGAAAGALWLTLQCFPLEAERGFGPILKACISAAKTWAKTLQASPRWALYVEPSLDIVTYFPVADRLSEVDRLSQALFEEAMNRGQASIFLSVYRGRASQIAKQLPHATQDTETVRILRSVLMKPEQAEYVPELHEPLSQLLESLF